MVTYDRWFLMPAKEFTDGNGATYTAPKYSDNSDISGFSGNTTNPSVVDGHYAALVQMFPDIDEWYIVRFYGEDNAGWQALNEIHNKQDTRTLADHANDVAPVLNDHFPELEWGGEEWANSFRVNL